MAESAVTFVELAGPGAAATLASLAATVGGASRTELLRALDQPALWLLVIRGAPPPEAALPPDARTWRFASAEAPS